jgi:outer membrane protein assembly factor BamD (BamD/ComL family)
VTARKLLAVPPPNAEHRRPMRRRFPRTPPAAALLSLLASCASAQPVDPDPERQISHAESLINAGSYDDALTQLALLDGDVCPRRLRDRRDVAKASAWAGMGELWESFLVLEKFSDAYPHSELRSTVVEMLWEIGRALAASDRGFLFFWSDRRAGRTVLEHLITRHPDTPRLADALRVLGDMAFEDANYELAQERFRDLMRRRPESEWVKYARFRYAMSIVDSLQGPEYDLDKMNHAVRELRDFLAAGPENPELLRTAEQALARLMEWRAERHIYIAQFYRRVGNVLGQQYHLDIASGQEFEKTEAYDKARDLRRELAEDQAHAATAESSP